jgi:hypothetical protein
MLLRHREIVDRLPIRSTVIYDWHYRPEVSSESAVFFKKRGFAVIGCPALMCYPYMILPSGRSRENIRRFAEIARDEDLLGLNTTIWIPTRYMSDVLWPGIAFAASHSWAGGNWDDAVFYRNFVRDFFGSPDGDAFARAWKGLGQIDWPLKRFQLSCWFDEKTLDQAQQAARGEAGAVARRSLEQLAGIQTELSRIRGTIRKNTIAWEVIERSAAILGYTLEHLLASETLQGDGRLDAALLRSLDDRCLECIQWIEADWDRNRFADDPYKSDLNRTGQHLLHRFHQMHAYHARLLAKAGNAPALQRSVRPPPG